MNDEVYQVFGTALSAPAESEDGGTPESAQGEAIAGMETADAEAEAARSAAAKQRKADIDRLIKYEQAYRDGDEKRKRALKPIIERLRRKVGAADDDVGNLLKDPEES